MIFCIHVAPTNGEKALVYLLRIMTIHKYHTQSIRLLEENINKCIALIRGNLKLSFNQIIHHKFSALEISIPTIDFEA